MNFLFKMLTPLYAGKNVKNQMRSCLNASVINILLLVLLRNVISIRLTKVLAGLTHLCR